MGELDDVLTSYTHYEPEVPNEPLPVAPIQSIPPPLQFFAPIKSFIKIEQQPVITFIPQPQQQFCPYVLTNGVKREIQAPINIRIVNNSNETKPLIQPNFFQPLKIVSNSSTSTPPLLFYNNSLYTPEQLRNISCFTVPQQPKQPAPQKQQQQQVSLATSAAFAQKIKKVRIKMPKKPNLARKSKKVKKEPLPFRDDDMSDFFEIGEDGTVLKRNMHNCMERQRRIGLKKLFVELKESIPDLDEYERVPKVAILCRAAEYCRELKNEELELSFLKNKNLSLLRKLNKLKRTME